MPFLVFEGLDGSGKSSLMTAFEKELVDRGYRYLRTREPGGTELGDEIRNLILRKDGQAPTPRTELLLYEASRAQHVDLVITPALQRNDWVLCDRFTASSIAFQAGGREIPESWVEQLNEFATKAMDIDLTVLLDLSVEESRRRRSQRYAQSGSKVAESEDRIESEADSFHSRVRQSFLSQAQRSPQKWLVLDASKSPDQLLQELLDYLKDNEWPGF